MLLVGPPAAAVAVEHRERVDEVGRELGEPAADARHELQLLVARLGLYPAALAWVAAGRVRLHEGRAEIGGAAAPGAALLNPLP